MPSKKRKALLKKRPMTRTRARSIARAAHAVLAKSVIPPVAAAIALLKLPAIGKPYGGGILLGYFFAGNQPRVLIGAPKAEGEVRDQQYHHEYTQIPGADDYYTGLANTEAMAKAGSASAQWARGLRIGGRDDWYLMSRGEALLADANNALLPAAEAFEKRAYWTSSLHRAFADFAWIQYFADGDQGCYGKVSKFLARAVRSEPI